MEYVERLRDELIQGFEDFLADCRVALRSSSINFEIEGEHAEFQALVEYFEEKIRMLRHHELIQQTVQMAKGAGGGKR